VNVKSFPSSGSIGAKTGKTISGYPAQDNLQVAGTERKSLKRVGDQTAESGINSMGGTFVV